MMVMVMLLMMLLMAMAIKMLLLLLLKIVMVRVGGTGSWSECVVDLACVEGWCSSLSCRRSKPLCVGASGRVDNPRTFVFNDGGLSSSSSGSGSGSTTIVVDDDDDWELCHADRESFVVGITVHQTRERLY